MTTTKLNLIALVIPGLSTENDMVKVSVSIGYDARTPDNLKEVCLVLQNVLLPEEGPSVEIVDSWPTSVRIQDKSGKETEYDPNKLTSEQQIILHKAIEDHVSQNEESITNTILDTLDFSSEPTERDYDVDEVIQPQYVEDGSLKFIGGSIIKSLISDGVAIEKWNIYEHDKNTIMFQIYLKLIKSPEIRKLLMLNGSYHGTMRMYSDKNLICVEIKVDRNRMYRF